MIINGIAKLRKAYTKFIQEAQSKKAANKEWQAGYNTAMTDCLFQLNLLTDEELILTIDAYQKEIAMKKKPIKKTTKRAKK